MNHRTTCILLGTGATVSVVNEQAWRKSGYNSNISPVTGTLTTANGTKLTSLGEAKVRFRLGDMDFWWPVIIVCELTHDCILGSDFLHHHGCSISYETGTLAVKGQKSQSDTAK